MKQIEIVEKKLLSGELLDFGYFTIKLGETQLGLDHRYINVEFTNKTQLDFKGVFNFAGCSFVINDNDYSNSFIDNGSGNFRCNFFLENKHESKTVGINLERSTLKQYLIFSLFFYEILTKKISLSSVVVMYKSKNNFYVYNGKDCTKLKNPHEHKRILNKFKNSETFLYLELKNYNVGDYTTSSKWRNLYAIENSKRIEYTILH